MSYNLKILFSILSGVIFLIIFLTIFPREFGGIDYFFIFWILLIISFNVLQQIRIVRIKDDTIHIYGEFLRRQNKSQLTHKLKVSRIDSVILSEIPTGYNSGYQKITTKASISQFLDSVLGSRYNELKAIVFVCGDEKSSIIINAFSKNQISIILDTIRELGIQVLNLSDEEVFKESKTNKEQLPTQAKKFRYPIWLGVLSLIGFVSFFGFAYYSIHHGGSALSMTEASDRVSDYVEGTYYLSEHGRYTETTEEIWNNMRIFEIEMSISFGVMFITNALFMLKNIKYVKSIIQKRE